MYYTGAVATTELFLDAIQSAAVAQGWTQVYRGVDPGGGSTTDPFRPDVLVLRDGSGYDFAMAYRDLGAQDELRVYGLKSTFDGGAKIADQSGINAYTNYAYIPCLKYHIFAESSYVYVLVEGETAHFRHFGIGQLNKGDSYPGGNFLFGHASNQSRNVHSMPFLRVCDSQVSDATFAALVGGDGNQPIWRTNSNNAPFPISVAGAIGSGGLSQDLLTANILQFNGVHAFSQLYCSVLRQGAYHSPIGVPPDMRVTARLSATPGQQVTLGSDDWMIFPVGKWGSASSYTESGNTAFAYFMG